MKLKQFRVTNFRSVTDSGWIEADKVTALVGVNESGKTNLLLPLWKLNPARDGEIQPTSDYPKALFAEIRAEPECHHFIEADFYTGNRAKEIAALAGIPADSAGTVRVIRYYDGEYYVEFPDFNQQTTVPQAQLADALKDCLGKLEAATPLKAEGELQPRILSALNGALAQIADQPELTVAHIRSVIAKIEQALPSDPAKSSVIVPIARQFLDAWTATAAELSKPQPGEAEGVCELVRKLLPTFVYYSNYGNLDSEIYLPHVVENLTRDDLGAKEAAKARTLKVLFSFVKLEPQEILELGRDFKDPGNPQRRPSTAEIEEIADKKKVRSILLQSASTALTEKFRDWWKQGDYRFRFEADGNHFRIWVADQRRPTEVELENRSTGLQWFLSFYLVFLVESQGEHKHSILLLDEPGLSLHPLAQRDLSSFFDSLANRNQLLYTSHSPFLIDADRLERTRKVYVATDGTTKATADLRHNEGKDAQEGAAYAVHSALNLSVAESLLVGCMPVLVEGPSDQHYLTTIKSLLVSAGMIKPKRELVFPPCGGTKTARVVASILTGRDESLPKILLDGDEPGKRMAEALKKELYVEHPDRVMSVTTFVGFEGAEIEDLFPPRYLAEELDRIVRDAEERLADVIQDGQPFVGQVEAWAKKNNATLPAYWKVTLATKVKQRALSRGIGDFDAVKEKWVKLFEAFA
jgi:energy-coupling factor transporter ATP-binding protein EcfA2